MNLKVMVVGDCNVGKTSLIYRYTKQKMPSDNALRFDNYKKCLNVDGEIFNLQIWDSNGHEVLLRLLSYSHTDVFLICFSIVDPTSFINVNDEWLVEIHKRMKNPVIILVGTKSDLRNDEATLQVLAKNGQKAVTPEEAKAKAVEINAFDYIECSAFTNDGVDQVFYHVISAYMDPRKDLIIKIQQEIKSVSEENSNLKEENGILKKLNKIMREDIELLKAKLYEHESVHKKPNILRPSGLSVDPSRFKEIRSIGQGRSGEVFLVEERETGIKYAMKKYYVSDFGENEFEEKRFIREIDFGASVDHPCVVKFVGYFFPTPKNLPTLFFEYARNGTLKDILKGKSTKFNSTHRALCVVEICMGMVYLHANGIIHRDLKPSNILVTDWKHFKISDFNDSTLASEDVTMTAGVGSQFFQSPEIINGFEYDSKTDVFSFGVILFMIMTGEVPKILMVELLNGKRAQIPPNITQFVAELISSCWSYSPDERPSFISILETLRLNDFMIFPDVDSDIVHERYEQIIRNH